jgi:outer membrane protein
MKKVFTLLFTAVVLMSNNAVNAQKIGIVSPDEIFAVMPDVRKADSTLGLYQNALAENYKEMETELNNALEKFFKDSSKMDKITKDTKRSTLQGKIQDLQGKQEDFNKQLETKKQEILAPIQEKLRKTIQEVATASGYTYVFYKEQTLVFPEADDITDKVKAKLGIKK